jgi:hypothetical protein
MVRAPLKRQLIKAESKLSVTRGRTVNDPTPWQAFISGFWRGMTAPAMLFSERRPMGIDIKHMPLPSRRTGTVADDWRSVGADIKAAYDHVVQRGG